MEQAEPSRRNRRRKKITPWQRRRRKILVLLGVFLLIISAWFIWRLGKRTALNDAMTEAASFGMATTKEEYEAQFGPYNPSWAYDKAVPHGKLYQSVLNAYVMPSGETLKHLPRFTGKHEVEELDAVPYAGEPLEAMRAMTEANSTALAHLQEATRSGTTAPTSHTQIKVLVEMLCAAACVRAHEGDVEGTFETLENAFILFRGGEREIGLESKAIGHMDQFYRLMMALSSVLRRVRFSEEQLNILQQHVLAGDWVAQQQQRDIQWRSRSMMENMGFSGNGNMIANLFTGFIDDYLVHDLKSWCVHRRLVGLSITEQDAYLAGFSNEPWHYYLRVNSPPVTQRVVSTSLSILRYERNHDRLPETLEALVPNYIDEVPTDFWSDAPLIYRVEGQFFTVYSVGRDRVDDGGVLKKDFVFKTTIPNSN